VREYLLTALVTATVTYLLVPLVRRFALRIGAAPAIRERDVHTVPIPRMGGLAMYGGLVAGLLVASRLPYVGTVLAQEAIMTPLLVGGGLIVLTGFLDDWWDIDAFIKLAGQIASAGLLVYFGMSLTSIPLPGASARYLDSTLQTIVTILIVVISINAVNFVDGLDGLAAGIVAIAGLATFAYSVALSWDIQDTRINSTAVITALLIGICAGFLPHNFHPARIFMGDTGAMLLGLLLASSMIKVTSIDPTVIPNLNRFPVILPMLLPVAVLVPPLADFLMAVIRRMSYGKSPFTADRGHLHHRLLDIGHSHRRTVLIMYAWTFLFAFTVVGLAIFGVKLIVFPFIVLVAIGVLILMGLPRWRSRGNGRGGAHAVGGPLRPAADPSGSPEDSAGTAAAAARRASAATG
jgi:UDP-GlcNAc:undecaprenyl-phosphate GlcNAc-1-phosphate transferase